MWALGKVLESSMGEERNMEILLSESVREAIP